MHLGKNMIMIMKSIDESCNNISNLSKKNKVKNIVDKSSNGFDDAFTFLKKR